MGYCPNCGEEVEETKSVGGTEANPHGIVHECPHCEVILGITH